jgi:raffinose/stachyose/melibiose transport system permease protein
MKIKPVPLRTRNRVRTISPKKHVEPLSYAFLAPAAFFILFIYALPFLFSVAASFTNWTGLGYNWRFIGFRNYRDLFRERRIAQVLMNNLRYLFFLVLVQNALSVCAALLLNKPFRGRNLIQAVVFMPTCIATVAVGFIWSLMFDSVNGPLPLFFKKILPSLSWLKDFYWLGDAKRAIYLIIFTSMWQWIPWNMVIYIAGLRNIPPELLEAGEVDGAGPFRRFFFILLPGLHPAIAVNMILSTISVLKFFDLPYVMTKGGPGYATETLAITTYSYTFLYNKLGYGTAISMVMFAGIMMITLIQFFFFRRGEGDFTL